MTVTGTSFLITELDTSIVETMTLRAETIPRKNAATTVYEQQTEERTPRVFNRSNLTKHTTA
jgi:hypothetical protein